MLKTARINVRDINQAEELADTNDFILDLWNAVKGEANTIG